MSLYFIGFFILWFFDTCFTEIFVLVVLHLIGICSLYTYWRMESWRGARYNSFGAVLLFISILFKWLCIVDIVIYGTRLEQWPQSILLQNSPMLFIYQGELITIIGLIFVVGAWKITVRHVLEKLSLITVTQDARHLIWLLYSVNIIVQFMSRILGVSFGVLNQLIGCSNLLGILSIYCIVMARPSCIASRRVFNAVFLALPLVFFGLSSGMKEAILLPLIPAMYITWSSYRQLKIRIMFVILGCGLFALLQIYVNYVRVMNWQENRTYTVSYMMSHVLTNLNQEILMVGMDSTFYRLNSSIAHALTVAITERDGIQSKEIFGRIPASFIPRFMWPDKPILQPGAEHTRRINNTNVDLSEIHTATSAGFFTEMYLGGHFIAVILGAILYGSMVGVLQVLVFKRLPNLAVLAFNFVILYVACRFDELSVEYAYTGLVLYFIFITVVFKCLYWFSRTLTIR